MKRRITSPRRPAGVKHATARRGATLTPALSRKREREPDVRLESPLPFTGSNREAVRRGACATAREGEGAATAPTLETLKHETPPASCNDDEAVKRATGRPHGTTLRTARETVKQPRKIQIYEGVTRFTAAGMERFPETARRRSGAAREALKHPWISTVNQSLACFMPDAERLSNDATLC